MNRHSPYCLPRRGKSHSLQPDFQRRSVEQKSGRANAHIIVAHRWRLLTPRLRCINLGQGCHLLLGCCMSTQDCGYGIITKGRCPVNDHASIVTESLIVTRQVAYQQAGVKDWRSMDPLMTKKTRGKSRSTLWGCKVATAMEFDSIRDLDHHTASLLVSKKMREVVWLKPQGGSAFAFVGTLQ